MVQIGDIVLPGDTINDLNFHNGVVLLGPGLRQQTDTEMIVSRSGIFCHKHPNVYWIDASQKRYIPKKGEMVIGVVIRKVGDTLKVDIGSSEIASLSVFVFEGATKKQRPDVSVGDIVYARLLSANREMEPDLVCIDSYFKAGRMGILSNDGFLFNISPELAQRLLNYDNPLLRTLGQMTRYEIVVGMNGKVWVHSKTTKDIDVIHTALLAAENQTDLDLVNICKK